MIIGIDIDDTLNNEYQFMIDFGTMYCNKIGKYSLKNIDTIESHYMFEWGEKTAHQFWNTYMETFCKLPAIPFSGEVIKKLKSEGHKIYIITAREKNDPWFPKNMARDLENITIKWLLDNGINFDKIFFSCEDKGKVCKENNVDIMIDDDPRNIDKLIGNTNVFVFDKPYNRKPEYDIVTRVYSWYDAYEKIKKLNAKLKGLKI